MKKCPDGRGKGMRVMDYFMHIEVSEGELKKTLDELMNAQETIRRCYHKLKAIGVVTIKEEATQQTGDL